MSRTPSSLDLAAPINHLLVLANPAPDSFCHAIAERYAAEAGACHQSVVVRDLYAIGFDPLLKAGERAGETYDYSPDVAAEHALIAAADILVLVYPIWFGLPPAILKGYVDRVLGAGYSFRDMKAQRGQAGLHGKPLLSLSTSGTSLPWLHEQGQVLSLREIFDLYLYRGFGMSRSEHIMIDSVVPDMKDRYAAEQLERVGQVAQRTCAMLSSDRHARERERRRS